MKRPLGLRQRLTILYVSFFAVLLMARGWQFRDTLTGILHRDAEAILEDEFAAAKRFVKVENGRMEWTFDRSDPDELPNRPSFI